MTTFDQTPLLHNSGGPPSAVLRWNGLRHQGIRPEAPFAEQRICWVESWFDFKDSEGVPESIKDKSTLSIKLDSLANFLVSKGLLQPVQIVAHPSRVQTSMSLPESHWLTMCLITKSTEHAWLQRRAPHSSRLSNSYGYTLDDDKRHVWKICISTPHIDPKPWADALSEWEAL